MGSEHTGFSHMCCKICCLNSDLIKQHLQSPIWIELRPNPESTKQTRIPLTPCENGKLTLVHHF